MKLFMNRQIVLLAVVLVLLVSACGLKVDSPFVNTAEPAATVDTGEIVKAVLAEVEGQLALQSEEQATQLEAKVIDAVQARSEALAQASESSVSTESIVETVLGEVQEQLALQEEPVPVIFGNEAAQSAVQNLEAALVTLYQQTNPSVVFIIVPNIGSGSGFVFDENGYIVTNNHVVEFGQEFEVVFSDGERESAELIGRDVDSDLAVIKVDQLPEGVPPLPLATAEGPQVGQFVVAIGNPFGEQGSMSLGIISGLNRSLSSEREASGSLSSYALPEVIQTDAPINPGNSGGPLLNLLGEVVGVNSAIRTTTGTNSGVGFSIPARAVARIIPSLIADGEYNYSYMGVSFDGEISLDDQAIYGLSQTQGAYVLGVTEGSPAALAGLIPASRSTGRGGDLIVAIDGQPILDFSDLNSYLVYEAAAGQTIEIQVIRNGQLVNLSLTLGLRP